SRYMRFRVRPRRSEPRPDSPGSGPRPDPPEPHDAAEPDTERHAAGPDDAPGQDAAQEPSELDLPPVAPPPAPVVVPRWVQLVLLPLSLLGLWALARAAGSVLLILIAAGTVALILAPLVRVFERKIPRGLAILAVYLTGIAVLAGIGFLLVNPVSHQISR